MCNINIILKKDRKETSLVTEIMNTMTWNSYKLNDDGEGALYLSHENKPVLVKSLGKLLYGGRNWFLATHQRFTTSGPGKGNTHPHETEHLILMHNGIFSGMGNKDKSDTREYVDLLEEEYVKQNGDTLGAIKALNLRVSGSYSIVVMDKVTGKIYYYKENSTAMYIIQNDQYLIMSTSEDNVKYAAFRLSLPGDIMKVEAGIIYNLLENMTMVERFSEKKWVYHTHQTTLDKGKKASELEVVVRKEGYILTYDVLTGMWVNLSVEDHKKWEKAQKHSPKCRCSLCIEVDTAMNKAQVDSLNEMTGGYNRRYNDYY